MVHHATKLSAHAPIKPVILAPVLSLSIPPVISSDHSSAGRKGSLKRKRYDNEEKANAILFYDDCIDKGVLDPVLFTSRETGIPAANISRWANGTGPDEISIRDHICKAACDLKLKRLKIRSRPAVTSKFPVAEAELAAEIRARRARGRKGRFLFKHRLNVDQVPLPFVVGDYDHTIDDKGTKDVWVRQPGSGLEKRQATLQICLRAGVDCDGRNLPQPPLAIWFRVTGKRITDAEKAAYHPDVHVYWQKCAWVDRPSSIEWQNGTLLPWLNANIPVDESVIFADNLDAQIQAPYLANQKEKGRALGWSLLKGGTHWSQPIDQGAGREVKRDVDYEQNEWLELPENLEKWESNALTASDRRILMTWWGGNGYARTINRVNINRYFEKTGCLMSVTGAGDEGINPEGLSTFTFQRPVIPAVIAVAPVQQHVTATSHAELQRAAEEDEVSEEDSELDEDDCNDEAEKWFIPDGYTSLLDVPSANQLNHSMVGQHLLFKWNGVGWCHGWVQKFYPKHRRGFNFEIQYADGDRRDHILRVQDYGHGDSVVAGAWCLLKKSLDM
ncbi:hypothetical protein CYMTET_37255 [Cymbomonas tetramitiformis]|uniref:Uncharacterized protein n=1 Tax=Cymbomonas tetramitiformis TaxID=36881 RepID=A0AAE0CE83_9CHLO|nr:hypothetical protein CYMTET_37255 [Cymbomonas tetramitiformis]